MALLPQHLNFDRDTATTIGAGILIAIVGKKLINYSEDWIFNLFPSMPEWILIVVMVIIAYYLIGCGK